MPDMKYYIAIDSGGSKTDAILCDENGNVLKRVWNSGANPMDIGVPAAQQIISDCVAALTSETDGGDIFLYAGIAGGNRVDMGLEPLLKEKYGLKEAVIEDDRRIAASATLGHAEGCGLICGTGCILSVIKPGEPIVQVGGHGYLIDTGGSGFDLGQAALKNVFRYIDGRGEYTVLERLIREKTGKGILEGYPDVYAGGRPYIASLSGLVFDGLALGDPISRTIAEKGAADIAELICTAARHFTGKFKVVLAGGIVSSHPEYVEMIRNLSPQNAELIMATDPPVFGALIEAAHLGGCRDSDTLRQNFRSTFKKINVIRVSQ